jgi:hypothetical protein
MKFLSKLLNFVSFLSKINYLTDFNVDVPADGSLIALVLLTYERLLSKILEVGFIDNWLTKFF